MSVALPVLEGPDEAPAVSLCLHSKVVPMGRVLPPRVRKLGLCAKVPTKVSRWLEEHLGVLLAVEAEPVLPEQAKGTEKGVPAGPAHLTPGYRVERHRMPAHSFFFFFFITDIFRYFRYFFFFFVIMAPSSRPLEVNQPEKNKNV